VETLVVEPILRAGLIDLDATFFIQFAIFLALYLIMSVAFFGPYTRFLKKRSQATEGMKARAKELIEHTKVIEAELDAKISKAREEAIRMRRELAGEGKRLRDEIVARERSRMQDELDKSLSELQAHKDDLLGSMDNLTNELAGMIQDQLKAAGGEAR